MGGSLEVAGVHADIDRGDLVLGPVQVKGNVNHRSVTGEVVVT